METQKSISDWGIQTFGPPASAKKIADRFMEEVLELDAKCAVRPADLTAIADECADCLIVLYQVAQTYGFDLHKAVDDKMTINRARIWKTDGDGIGQHVEE